MNFDTLMQLRQPKNVVKLTEVFLQWGISWSARMITPDLLGIASSDITKLKSADFGKAISDERVLIHFKNATASYLPVT